MAKVFRFHKGSDNIEDWQNSTAYGKNAIEAIQDPSGATASREITSIPSPFARIDLVKTAFENIVNGNNLEGNTIFHKMVSDCFDIGEIFFNSDKLKDKVSIITWDKANDLEVLLKSTNPRHRLLGETLKLYLEQDAKAYNFADTQRLFLLNYKAGPNAMNIIGGTSPATLFFTSANDLKYVNIQFGNDIVFDANFQPLYKRDFAFQKLIFGIRKFMDGFTRSFKSLDDYLEMSFRMLTDVQKGILNSYTKAEFENEFEKLTAGFESSPVEVLGFPMRKKTEQPANIEEKSGFVIASAKYGKGTRPLVLPVDDYSEKTIYTSDFWNRNNKAGYNEEKPLKERILPFDGGKYPYLTISDFLEPYIVRTVYPIHKEKFFDGNFSMVSGEITKGYLLPIRKEYFDYFDVADLQGVVADGKKALEIRQMARGGVTVTLRIPIQHGKYITYERMYYPPTSEYQIAEPELSRNRGAIIENQFGLTLYPFLKLQEDSHNHYRVAFMDRDIQEHTKHNKYALQFYKNLENSQVKEKAVKQRSEKTNDNISSSYYVIEDGFDYVEIKNNWANGLLIPLFRPLPQGTSQFTFAVDFGTTNTHIEYKKDNGDPRPFEIEEGDVQIATLHDPKNPETIKSLNKILLGKLLIDIIPQEIIPQEINSRSEFHFPLRTAINSNVNLDIDKETYALADFNIPFVYEKYLIAKNAKTRTNLKWSNFKNPNEAKVIDAFFENLLLLIRNKVLLNGGDLNKVKLIWLYPSSMTAFRIGELETKWNSLFKKYINTSQIPDKLSESIAPFYYFNTQLGINAMANSVVSIDIGGGTTDVVAYKNNQPEMLTSFRFAANAIFGDAFGRSSQINGFIQKYAERIKYLLETNNQYDLSKVLENVKENGKSEDIIAFFFSIEKNRKIMEQNIPISFTGKLKLNSDLKIVFILFYASIVYHVAKIMKVKNLGIPRHITFSGTGSKIINITDGTEKLDTLTRLTQIIFREVFEEAELKNIELKQDAFPKEISCKGALKIQSGQIVSVDAIKTVLLGTTEDILISNTPKTYKDLDDGIEGSIVKEYEHFIDWIFGLNKELSFKNYFGINPSHLETYKVFLKENALDDLKSGIQQKKKELEGDLEVDLEETLFFYPLIGGLNNLAYKIHSELNTQQV